MSNFNVDNPKSIKNVGQQGDVLIQRTTEKFSREKKLKHLRLAEGEATGHCHLAEGDCALYELENNVDQLMLEVFSGNTTIKHQEHGPLVVGPGTYKIGRIREKDHFADEAEAVRRVAD